MAYQALLFCADPRTTRVLTAVLQELDFNAEPGSEPFEAVKKLTARHFDAVFVDCDDEQNAALLFKSARNSELNKASLAVGIVAGQAAITKAFRIGANLVLTKPINVEQAKGTLRVARGLLKKSEQVKPAKALAPALQSFETPGFSSPQAAMAPNSALIPPPPKTPAPTFAPAPALQLEVEEKDPAPPLGPAETALLESMPEEIPVRPVTGLSRENSGAKEPRSTMVSKPGLSPKDASSVAGRLSFSSATAAMPAPAKELTSPVVEPATARTSTHGAPADTTASKTKKLSTQPTEPAAGEPANFSWHEAAREQDESEDKDSRKNLLIAAVLVLAVAGAAYYAWPVLQPEVMNLTFVQKYVAPYLGRLGPQPSAATAPARPTPTPAKPAAGSSATAQSAPTGSSQPAAEQPSLGTATPADDSAHATAPNAGIQASAPSGPKPAVQLAHVSGSAMEGSLLKKVQPIYPADAARMRIEGTVQLQAEIAKDGSIASVKSLRGEPALARAAMDAVRQWKYKPYLVNGQPSEVQTEITVNFKLP